MDWKATESRPGSFSKNFGWGDGPGLELLHKSINEIFSSGLEPIPREEARETISRIASGDPLVPLNFFLYHQIIDGVSCVVPDQLVLEALGKDHDRSFDLLGMSALNFSRVGTWKGARPFQSHPAPWARRFMVEEVWDGRTWDTTKMDADTIEIFLEGNMIYGAETPRKFATNLNFLYRHSGLIQLRSSEREDWWAGAVFLFLDRCHMDEEINLRMPIEDILGFMVLEDFWALTAANPTFAPFAARAIIQEYVALGGISRLQSSSEPITLRKPKDRLALPKGQRKLLARAKKPDDLGLSSVQRVYAQAQRQVRNKQHAAWVKQLYDDQCAICGKALIIDTHGNKYSEAGHVQPVGQPFDGPDHFRNILPFCPNHHKAFDRGGVWIDPEGTFPRACSATSEREFHGRKIELLAEHDFGLEFVEWHAKYFGHI